MVQKLVLVLSTQTQTSTVFNPTTSKPRPTSEPSTTTTTTTTTQEPLRLSNQRGFKCKLSAKFKNTGRIIGSSRPDPYFKLYSNGRFKIKGKHFNNEKNPVWKFKLKFDKRFEGGIDDKIKLVFMEHDSWTKHDKIGESVFDFEERIKNFKIKVSDRSSNNGMKVGNFDLVCKPWLR